MEIYFGAQFGEFVLAEAQLNALLDRAVKARIITESGAFYFRHGM